LTTVTPEAANAAPANTAPTNISLSSSLVVRNVAGSPVGTLSTTDADSGESFTYSLVTGDGSTDNAKCTLQGSTLLTASALTDATGGTYSVRVRSTDHGGLSTEKAFTVTVVAALDIDANGQVEALNDGLIILRYLFDFRGSSLVRGALGTGALRTDPSAIVSVLASLEPTPLDVDGNTQIEPMNDGLLLLRYLFDFRGTALVRGVVGQNATRTVPTEIAGYLDSFLPTSAKSSSKGYDSTAIPDESGVSRAVCQPLPSKVSRLYDAVFAEDSEWLVTRRLKRLR
jgi:hypothetical protein